MRRIAIGIACLVAIVFIGAGCALVGCDRVFPHFTWYWSAEAVRCRQSHELSSLGYQLSQTNLPASDRKRLEKKLETIAHEQNWPQWMIDQYEHKK